MIWAVLIGNTRTVSALMRGDTILKRVIVPTATLKSAGMAGLWAKKLRRLSQVEGIVVASVVPPVDKHLEKSIRKAFGLKPHFVTHQSPVGVKVDIKKPAQVGADRLANAVAAKEFYGSPVIVVDYGTGTTFDVVNKAGDYFGGAILPGLGISTRALHEFTAKIPLVKFEKVKFAIGRTTEEAVRAGVYHGAIGTTKELLLAIRKELKSNAPAIATGGFCKVFEKTRLFKHVEPDLTLKGIAAIWRKLNAR
jgi:type III pantothenate kinase